MPRISILIPSRSEVYLQQTVDDVFKHAEGEIEILIGMDGGGSDLSFDKPLHEVKPKTNVFFSTEPIGQRKMMNVLAKNATGDYLMKLDAHCSLSQGFDVAMLKDIEPDSVIVPALGKLNVKNWTIPPTPLNSNFVLNTNLEFHYAPNIPELVHETMTIQGSGFMVSRENYWKWNLCDEVFGSWGMGGAEVALKTWLLGGRVLSTKNAFMGHWFRMPEDGGDGFPYERDMKQVNHAFAYARELFLGNKLKGQKRSMQWLIEKFNLPLDWSPIQCAVLCAPFNDVVE